MTLKQDELVKRLPENDYNIAKTMRDVGYSKQSSRAGSLYASLRKKIEKAYNPEQIKADILKAEAKMLKDNDNSNLCRLIELRAKILGLTKEVNAGQQVMINITDTLDKLKAPKPIDVTHDI